MKLGPYIPPWMPDHWARAERLRWTASALARATSLLVIAFCVAHAVWGPCVRPWYAGSAAVWVFGVWCFDVARADATQHAMLLDVFDARRVR